MSDKTAKRLSKKIDWKYTRCLQFKREHMGEALEISKGSKGVVDVLVDMAVKAGARTMDEVMEDEFMDTWIKK